MAPRQPLTLAACGVTALVVVVAMMLMETKPVSGAYIRRCQRDVVFVIMVGLGYPLVRSPNTAQMLALQVKRRHMREPASLYARLCGFVPRRVDLP